MSKRKPMVEPRSFAQVLSDTAYQKAAAARSRAQPSQNSEKPADAIAAAMSVVSAAMSSDSFEFSKSGRKLSKKLGDLTFSVSFQSDRNNIAGERAAIWPHVAVYDRIVTEWRRRHTSEWVRPAMNVPLPVVASQLGYLGTPSGWLEWDFADPAARDDLALDLTRSIRSRAFPLFAIFEDGADGVAALSDLEMLGIEGILTYLLAHGEADLAQQAIARYLEAEGREAKFLSQREAFLASGLPPYRGDVIADLAAFSVATNYPWA